MTLFVRRLAPDCPMRFPCWESTAPQPGTPCASLSLHEGHHDSFANGAARRVCLTIADDADSSRSRTRVLPW